MIPPHVLSRRTLLAAGLVAVGAAACGGGGGGGGKAEGAGSDTGNATSGPDDIELQIATAELVSGSEQRITVGVLQNAEPVKAGTKIDLAVGLEGDKLGPWQPAERHDAGVADHPYYKITHRFDRPGNILVAARAGGPGGKTGAARWQVIAPGDTKVPIIGQPMIKVATPTTADDLGVQPICTRQPVCPFHSVSLDAALTSGKPVAALFATPAFCQSKTCGPVLDVLTKVAPEVGDAVQVVHIEVFDGTPKNFTQDEMSPAMKAYNLSYEPILFLAGADGIVRDRLLGPFDEVEARQSLTRLTTA